MTCLSCGADLAPRRRKWCPRCALQRIELRRHEYGQRPEVRARVLAYKRAYDKSPEVAARRRDYQNRPDVRARRRASDRRRDHVKREDYLCRVCKERKPASRFPVDAHTKTGRTSTCRACLEGRRRKLLERFGLEQQHCEYCNGWFTPRYIGDSYCRPKCQEMAATLDSLGHSYVTCQCGGRLTFGSDPFTGRSVETCKVCGPRYTQLVRKKRSAA